MTTILILVFSLSRLNIPHAKYREAISLINDHKLDVYISVIPPIILSIMDNTDISRPFDLQEGEHIYSYSKPIEWPMFTFFRSFDISAWLAIIISLIIITIITSIFELNLDLLQNTFWRYGSVLLSEPFPTKYYQKAKRFLSQRIILTAWLLSCTVLLSAFSGVLRDFFMKKITPEYIDSFEQLIANNDIKIIIICNRYFYNYIRNNQNSNYEIRKLSRRVECVENFQISNPENKTTIEVFSKVKSGKYVLVINKTLFDSILNYKITDWTKLVRSKLYSSEKGFTRMFYSFLYSKRISILKYNINNM
jgi:hypothetical protein